MNLSFTINQKYLLKKEFSEYLKFGGYPEVVLDRGKGIKREILRNKQDHLVLGDDGHVQEIFPIFFKQFINECEREKIKERILCSPSVLNKVKKFDYKYSTTKALPSGISFPTTTLIYGDKIVLFNWQLPYNAIIILNKNLADTYRNYFDILWKSASA